MAENSDMEKTYPTKTTDLGQDERPPTGPSHKKSRLTRAFRFWPLLIAYTVCCIALSLVLTLVIDGFNAVDTSTARYIDGKLQLRVSDITTLISAALVIIKFFATSWAAVAVWRCAYELTHTTDVELSRQQLSFMMKYRLPPWAMYPFQQPNGFRSWTVAAILLCVLPQPFIAPLLSGAVNWNPSLVPGSRIVPVNSTSPAASGYFYQYKDPTYTTSRDHILKTAAGVASLAWSDSSTVSTNGTSLTGNGCRHVVNDDGLLPNSTLTNSIVPCIKFDNISWATSANEIPSKVTELILSSSLSLVNDSTERYNQPGHAVLFDPNLLWNSSQDPTPTLVSGPKSLGLVIAHQYNCTKLDINSFGDINNIPQYIYSWALGTCYIFANITLTAGVVTSAVSRYISSRVIEDQTPIDEAVFEPNSWVQESFWLLPDLMSFVSLMNSSLLPTWDNIDLYAESLIRQTYLAAWDTFHMSYDKNGSISNAIPQERRVKATVSYSRVFAWLGVSLLMTVGGILLLALPLKKGEPDSPSNSSAEQLHELKTDAKDIMEDLKSLDLF